CYCCWTLGIIINGGHSKYRDITRWTGDFKANSISFVGVMERKRPGIAGHSYLEETKKLYGNMQLICEAYHLMKYVLGMEKSGMVKTFEDSIKEPYTLVAQDVGQEDIGKSSSNLEDGSGSCHPHWRTSHCSHGTMVSEGQEDSCRLCLSPRSSLSSKLNLLRQTAAKFDDPLNYGLIFFIWKG
ncbi:hypothetical protein J0S82_008758, partial [Galemys pyrenaicus]